MIDIMGPQEVADLLGVQVQTVRLWRSKGEMPEPDRIISRIPIWTASTIVTWAVLKGKLEISKVE